MSQQRYSIRKTWTGLTEEQVRKAFPEFEKMTTGNREQIIDREDVLSDGSKAHLTVSLLKIKPTP